MKSKNRIEYKQIVEGRTEAQLSAKRRAIDDSFLDETIRLFQSRTNRPLNREDARQMIENVTGFFRILAEWNREDQAKMKDSTDAEVNGVGSVGEALHWGS